MPTKQTIETDTQLLARQAAITDTITRLLKGRNRMKHGGARDARSRHIGSLNFTLGGIESEIQDRGLSR